MHVSLRFFLLFFLAFALSTCNINKRFNYHDDPIRETEILINNHIHKITETRIEFGQSEKSIWKRIESIKFFDDNGLNTKTIRPAYISEQTGGNIMKGQSVPSPRSFKTTYLYAGFMDTIYMDYNNRKKLKKETKIFHDENGKQFSIIIEYEYDNNENLIKTCTVPENSPISCVYRTYVYGKEGQIISRKDSCDYLPAGVQISYDLTKLFQYKYDDNRNLISNGLNVFTIDEKGNVLECIPTKISPYRTKRKFDSQGKVIYEVDTYFNPQENKVMEQNEKKYYKYNAQNLLIEKKIVNENYVVRLFKYEYE